MKALDDDEIRQKLAVADEDIADGRVDLWDAEDIKRRGRARLHRAHWPSSIHPEDLKT